MANRFTELLDAQRSGKALGFHPAFESPGAVQTTDLNLGKYAGVSPNTGMTRKSTGSRTKQSSAKRHTESYGGDQAMDWVMTCSRYVAETVANAEYHFEKTRKPSAEKTPGDSVVPPEALFDLLRKPNPYQDYIEMMELLTIDLLLTGNAYIFKWRTNEKGQPLALYRLAPPYVEIETASWGPASYVYQVPNASKVEALPENIIHFKLPNPEAENPYYGVGLISGAGRSADLELALTDSQASYFENHAMPSMVLEAARRIPRDVFRKIRAQVGARAQGSRNAGELLTLEMGLKLQAIAPNAVDAAFLELSKFSRDRIFSWFRMSPKLVGIEDAHGAAKLADVQRQYDLNTARPLMNKIQEKLSQGLALSWDLEFVIDYQYQLAPEEQATLGAVFAKIPGITVDEIRKFTGLPPHPEKEIGEMTLNLPGAEGGEGGPGGVPTENGFPDRNLPGEGGRPPNGENTKQFPKHGEALPNGASVRKAKKEGKALDEILQEINALTDEAPILQGKATLDPGQPPEDVLFEKRDEEVDAATHQLRIALTQAAQTLGREVAQHVDETKAIDNNKVRALAAWKKFEAAVTAAYGDALAKAMSAAVLHHSEVGIQPQDEIDYAELTSKLVKSKTYGVQGITNSLKKSITKNIKEARSNNEDPTAAVTRAITDWEQNKAQVIAQTTAVAGYNESTLETARSAGSNKVIVSDGTDHDEPCVQANGEIWSIDKAKDNLLEHPNCRRAFVPLMT